MIWLVTDRGFAGFGVGPRCWSTPSPTRGGVGLARVGCYAGSEGRLVEYYRRNGFEPVEAFRIRDWPRRLPAHRVA